MPVDFGKYKDVYVFCDSDPIGYYLSYKKIPYHALEDGLDCLATYDTARYDNRGHFGLKAFLAARNLIFIQNGWAKYCLDMEVNDLSVLPYPCPKYIEKPRKELTEGLDAEGKDILVRLFIEDMDEILEKIHEGGGRNQMLLLTEPLCELDVRERIFRDCIEWENRRRRAGGSDQAPSQGYIGLQESISRIYRIGRKISDGSAELYSGAEVPQGDFRVYSGTCDPICGGDRISGGRFHG